MSQDASREAHTTLRRLRHDMRTSIGQILGYSEMLQEEAEDRELPEMGDDLKKIHSSAGKLLAQVDQIFQTEAEASPSDSPAVEAASAADEAAQTTVDGEAVETPTEAQAGGALLVVDDDQNNRDILCRRLTRSGHTVTSADGGKQALQLISENDFDVVLLDVMMPEMDGFEVLERVRKRHTMSDLPVIMATALQTSDDIVAALKRGANDYVSKPFDMPVVLARVAIQLSLKQAMRQIQKLAGQLQIRNAFIRRTLGRYVSDEVATDLLENPESFEVRGEKRTVSIMMTDLRGFSSLTETLAPIDVVKLLNNYLGSMAGIIQDHDGTIDEFIGDAILALFGAPTSREDDAARAVTCALVMQKAMADVNARNAEMDLPSVEMGIGISTGEVIVGNIGSERRAKYSAVGSTVNLTARVESYTLGGEILITTPTLEAGGRGIRVGEVREVRPKGFEQPIEIHQVVGLEGRDELSLSQEEELFVELVETIPLRLAKLEGKDISTVVWPASIRALSTTSATVRCEQSFEKLTNLSIQLVDETGNAIPGSIYGKVTSASGKAGDTFKVRFTARSTALDEVVRSALDQTDA